MIVGRWLVVMGMVAAVTTGPSAAQAPPSFAKQVRPFLAKYCVECHGSSKARADLSVESLKGLMEGGKQGPALVPGQPDESLLVLSTEGKFKPFMPPPKSRQPTPKERELLRAWVKAGALDDSASVKAYVPDIKPRATVRAPITALAFTPDGKLLAAGGHREVLLIDAASNEVTARLPGHAAKVTALCVSRDGRWLAAASGDVGMAGEVRLFAIGTDGMVQKTPVRVLAAHLDLIHEVVFSPDGELLATAGYDRLIKLWDTGTGKELRVLKDHSDAVYGLAFSPDGSLLASAAADRAVKVWDVKTGRRLYTLGESTDWLYALAWNPSGHQLVAGGVDKSLRLWEVKQDGSKLLRSVFAHEAAVLKIAWSADATTLYTLGEDRVVKVWDAIRLSERKVLPAQPDSVLSLAVRPNTTQIALGRYDGALVIVNGNDGKVLAQPLPVKPRQPKLTSLMPNAGTRGSVLRVTLQGTDLDQALEVTTTLPDAGVVILAEGRQSTQLIAEVRIPSAASAGTYQLVLKGPVGQPVQLPFLVDAFAPVPEREPNDSPATAAQISYPASVVGDLSRAGEVDFYRFDSKEGQQTGVQVVSRPGSKLQPVLQVCDAHGHLLVESSTGVLGFTCKTSGAFAIGIRDREFRGGSDFAYRLHIGDIPVVTSVFPLGLQAGQTVDVQVSGVHLGLSGSVRVEAPATAKPGDRIIVKMRDVKALGVPSLVVGEFPEIRARSNGETTSRIPVPGTANGRLDQPGQADTWRFVARKGQRLIIEVDAMRLGSALDSFLEILDSSGQPVPRAVLRSVAKTYTTFRDHDSAGSGIRIETWGELSTNDHLLVGSELLRIRALPRNPDDDCQFFSVGGQRVGYLDTTPSHQPMGREMYKVEIHPPGTTFSPNGYPVLTLPYRNDDGGPGYGKDSRLYFDPPTDGEFLARLTDTRGLGGENYAYRLTVRPPRPDFSVNFTPFAPSVWRGGAIPITVNTTRSDNFDGPIRFQFENLPAGINAPVSSIPAGETSTSLALAATASGVSATPGQPFRLVARATIDGNQVVREAVGGMLKVVEPGDLQTSTEQTEITIRAGGETRLTAKIDRRNGFAGRVPLDVRGLPHGVRVLDVGLNGILITEKETVRTFALYCEPWVVPTTHPIVVLARSERKGTEHAAPSVLLRIEK